MKDFLRFLCLTFLLLSLEGSAHADLAGKLPNLNFRTSKSNNLWKVEVGKAPVKGPKNALVTVVMFGGFQSRFTANSAKQLKSLLVKYKGKIRLVFKHYTLSFYKQEQLAAEASMAAHAQGQFWAYHDLLFTDRHKLKRPQLEKYALQLKLDMKKFKHALDKRLYKKAVDLDKEQGSELKVYGTPSIFVNGRRSKNSRRLEFLIKQELHKATGLFKKGLKAETLYKHIIASGKHYPSFRKRLLKVVKYIPTKGAMKDGKKVAFSVPPALRADLWKLRVGNSPVKGPKKALVTIALFGGFQCPFTAQVAKKLKVLLQKHKGKVRLVFKHYPFGFHKQGQLAAEASVAAQAQGKFWQYHDLLFTDRRKLKRPHLEAYAKQLGLDMKTFKHALDKRLYRGVVDFDKAEGKALKVSGTPSLFVNGRKVNSGKLEKELKQAALLASAFVKKGWKAETLYSRYVSFGRYYGPFWLKVMQEPKALPIQGSPAKGAKKPLVTIVKFTDFQCPACTYTAKTLSLIAKAYKKYVRVVYKAYPLPSIHPDAYLAAQAAVEAHRQGKFWEFYHLLFLNTRKLKRVHLGMYAMDLKLDLVKFSDALVNGTHKATVNKDMALGKRLKLTGTPTVFLNGHKLRSSASFKSIKKILDKILLKNGVPAADLPERPAEVIPIHGSAQRGSAKPLVTIVKFSDFQCYYCSCTARGLGEFTKAYKAYVRVVFKHFPLSFHKDAHLAAQASMAAHAQGKFWQYHDLLFTDTRKLKRPHLLAYARKLNLDMKKFTSELDSKMYKAAVDRDIKLGSKVGVSGTPTIFINGRKKSASSFKGFKRLIDPILIKKGVKKSLLPEKPAKVIPIHGSPQKGSVKPLVTIVKFSGFQCGFCGRASRKLDIFANTYKKYVRVVYKHFPLSFHKQGHLAAQASMAAHAQGKFWQYHDLLFANQRKLKRPHLLAYAKKLGLDMKKFTSELDSKMYKAAVDRDYQLGVKVGVRGTPTFFFNGRMKDAYNFEGFKRIVDPILIKRGVKKSVLPTAPALLIPIKKVPWKGSQKPLVTLVKFGNFQCYFCSKAAVRLKTLQKLYPKRLRIVFKHFPLRFHKHAHLAAQASMAAHAQGKFWQYHDLLFANIKKLKRTDLERYAQQLKLDMAKFKKALNSGQYKAYVDKDYADGIKLGVAGTPTIFINGRVARGSSLGDLKRGVEAALKRLSAKK